MLYPTAVRRNDCMTRAIVNCTGLGYQQVWKHLSPYRKNSMIHMGDNSSAMVHMHLREIYQELGFYLFTYTHEARTIVTLERELPKKGHFHIRVRGHSLAFIDGETIDWAKHSRRVVKAVFRITPVAPPGMVV